MSRSNEVAAWRYVVVAVIASGLTIPAILDAQRAHPPAPNQPRVDSTRVDSAHVGSSGTGGARGRPTVLDATVVTATRTALPVHDVPADVVRVDAAVIDGSAAKSVPDLLRVIPGFNLRDSESSLVSNLSRQVPTVRGLGGTASSRILVLLDGVPINEPFSGWVFWPRVPLGLVERAELVRGGAAGVWGDRALGGAVNLITVEPTANTLRVSASGGSYGTVRSGAVATLRHDRLGVMFAGDYLGTDGYINIPNHQRGPVDAPANSHDAVAYGKAVYDVTPLLSVNLAGSYMHDYRHNGTVLSTNGTSVRDLRGGFRLLTQDGSLLTGTAYASVQSFTNFSSSESPDHQTEQPSLDQFDVPATAFGTQLQWSKELAGRHQLTTGVDASWVDGADNEDYSFSKGAFTRQRHVGGQQLLSGAYLQDAVSMGERAHLLGSVRYDIWRNRAALRTERELQTGRLLLDTSYAAATDSRLSSTVGIRYETSNALSLRGSVYSSFRAPTLNELYRPVRERGNVITEANAALRPERLAGADVGADYAWSPGILGRLTAFWNQVSDPIVEATVAYAGPKGSTIAPCGFVPAGGVCHQRRNLGGLRTAGIEADLEAHPHPDWTLRAGYIWNPTKVTSAPGQPDLVGKVATGTARTEVTATVAFDHPALFALGLTTRYVGRRFDDDRNTLVLDPFTVTDVRFTRPITQKASTFISIENLFDAEYAATRAPDGSIRIGGPRFLEAGMRYQW